MGKFKKRSTVTERRAQFGPGYERNVREFRVVVSFVEDDGSEIRLTGDGTTSLLDLLKGSTFFTDLSKLAIDDEPEPETREYAEWRAAHAGLQAVPGNGTRLVLSGSLVIEGLEDA